MAKAAHIDIEAASRLLHYNSENGVLTWTRSTGKAKAGTAAGCLSQYGYIKVTVCGKTYLAHRVAWALHFMTQPPCIIDHINGNKTDNRICNLRNGEDAINQQNQRSAHSRNKTSRLLGVSMFHGRWRAKIYHKGRYIFLGYHPTAEAAHAAYLEAKRKIHQGCEI